MGDVAYLEVVPGALFGSLEKSWVVGVGNGFGHNLHISNAITG